MLFAFLFESSFLGFSSSNVVWGRCGRDLVKVNVGGTRSKKEFDQEDFFRRPRLVSK